MVNLRRDGLSNRDTDNAVVLGLMLGLIPATMYMLLKHGGPNESIDMAEFGEIGFVWILSAFAIWLYANQNKRAESVA